MGRLMTQGEFARHRGVGKSAVSNWKRDGLLVMGEGAGGKLYVDVERSDARLNARFDPMRGRPTSTMSRSIGLPLVAGAAPDPCSQLPDQGETLQSVRVELIRRQSAGHALRNAQAAGELAPLVELVERAQNLSRSTRERIQGWFRGEAERLAAERDIRVIISICEEGIDRIFVDLADQAAAGGFAAEDREDPDLEAQAEADMEAAIAADHAALRLGCD
jgi:hypothetical protein